MTKDIHKATTLPPSDMAYIVDPEQPVLTHGRNMQAEAGMVAHDHPRGQLLWSEQGILRVSGEESVWVVSSTHAMWIPGGITHQVSSETDTKIRNLYIDPFYPVRKFEKNIAMLTMTPLMQEIILRLAEQKNLLTEQRLKHLGLVAIDELEILERSDVYIHSGKDPRLQRLVSYMVQHPQQTLSLVDLSSLAGASVRTMERLFKAETGMTYRQWRSRFKLMNALGQLNEGQSTTAVAHQLGYKSVSSFIHAFKMQFGFTPQAYASRN
ncbi:AraC family transcriptional regulator [Psychromonas sp. B3M02]|uniref:AraC family transcriptional regulator n=1 Tax=Psychromonas sp. B3M02 TaxID=2267226 RepID=UPI000DE81ABE|nr:helix-turn-helix transcriptional regulator [Psychromonas sp. B3M02]RBW47925.1 AraC family transcriptional regulator [Psychromonas sp. B3M02]